MMKIIMMIFYKEKFIVLMKIKIFTEDLMIIVTYHFATVNLNTFVFAEAKRDCL